jgi:hypothetical protein
MHMEEKICLTGMLLWTNHGCITTNKNQSMLRCNGNTEMKVWKWLRQQSKDFYPAGFDALVKQWDKCINVGGGYVEK